MRYFSEQYIPNRQSYPWNAANKRANKHMYLAAIALPLTQHEVKLGNSRVNLPQSKHLATDFC